MSRDFQKGASPNGASYGQRWYEAHNKSYNMIFQFTSWHFTLGDTERSNHGI